MANQRMEFVQRALPPLPIDPSVSAPERLWITMKRRLSTLVSSSRNISNRRSLQRRSTVANCTNRSSLPPGILDHMLDEEQKAVLSQDNRRSLWVQQEESEQLSDYDQRPCSSGNMLPSLPIEPEGAYQMVDVGIHSMPRLTSSISNLHRQGWYWGPISRQETEQRLKGLPEGSFLVRDSADDCHLMSLSFRLDTRTLHTRIEYCNGLFSFYAHPSPGKDSYATIEELINKTMENSRKGENCHLRSRDASGHATILIPVILCHPVSRFTEVRSLMYLSRFIIRQYIRYDKIHTLPLPASLKSYVAEQQY